MEIWTIHCYAWDNWYLVDMLLFVVVVVVSIRVCCCCCYVLWQLVRSVCTQCVHGIWTSAQANLSLPGTTIQQRVCIKIMRVLDIFVAGRYDGLTPKILSTVCREICHRTNTNTVRPALMINRHQIKWKRESRMSENRSYAPCNTRSCHGSHNHQPPSSALLLLLLMDVYR